MQPAPQPPAAEIRPGECPQNRRMLTDAKERAQAFLAAAREYPERISKDHLTWLYMKPFEWTPGQAGFYYNMHNALGLLRAMKIPAGGDVLEIGCGPGWLTEMLAMLGFRVTALEPSGDLLKIARHRIESAAAHHKTPVLLERVRFIEGALEEVEIDTDAFDAVIFYDVLHHVLDEETVFRKCAAALHEGGVLGVIEGAWIPGNKEQEAALFAEMAEYGTLENPFTQEYLDWLLAKHGFERAKRLIGVSGMYPVDMATRDLASLAPENPVNRNDLIAWRPAGPHKFSNDAEADTRLRASIGQIVRTGEDLRLTLRVENIGSTILIGGAQRSGAITFCLKRKSDDGATAECGRVLLPASLRPGETTSFEAVFVQAPRGSLVLDTGIEHIAWLSDRGIEPLPVHEPSAA